ncbi:MAG: RidA family protein [Deltaproteobacteria bacterium]|nr:RidA family protein [Deltaproteobacteria bacterium]
MEIIQVPGWPRPKGYSNAIVVRPGRLVVLAGQVGWDEQERIVPGGLVAQFDRALHNVLVALAAAGGQPEHLVLLRIYLTDREAYLRDQAALGQVWRARMGRHYPCMCGLVIAGLVEDGAVVELEGLAVLPDDATGR